MPQQSENITISSNHLRVTTNENELKRRDLDDDRDTGDMEKIKTTTTTTTTTTIAPAAIFDAATKRNQFIDKELKDRAIKIIRNGIDRSKEILTTIKRIFKL